MCESKYGVVFVKGGGGYLLKNAITQSSIWVKYGMCLGVIRSRKMELTRSRANLILKIYTARTWTAEHN